MGMVNTTKKTLNSFKFYLRWLSNKLIFDNIKSALGMDRTRLCATAAAPISLDTLNYFMSLNIPIYEIYGMSECTGPCSANLPNQGQVKI